MKSILIGSKNPHKKDKLKWIVKDHFEQLNDVPSTVEVEENGSTFEENAGIKAKAISSMFHHYSISTDGGALIPALGNNWNALFTRRFVGREDASDWDRMDMLLEMMRPFKGDDRKVIWREAIAIADPNGEIIFSCEVEGDTGLIQESYRKDQYREGIWLCTLTSYPQFNNKNFFELSEDEVKEGEISWWRLKAQVDSFFTK